MKTRREREQALELEEQELEKTLSLENLKSSMTDESKAALVAAAKAHIAAKKKDARVNLRVSAEDLMKAREIAESEGLGYQTLMSSIIHKYLTKQLVDKRVLEELKDTLLKKTG